jgi:hypothetical protein
MPNARGLASEMRSERSEDVRSARVLTYMKRDTSGYHTMS